jgi:Big-like domain-containing protein
MRGFKDGYGFVGLIVILLFGFLTLGLGAPIEAAAYEVKIAAPLSDSVVSGTVAISLLMKSSTSWANVYVDGVYLASTPNAISWSTTDVANGLHTISAKAYDSSNQVIGTSSRSVHVRNKATPTPTSTSTPSATPTPGGGVSITSPKSGATVSGTVSIAVQYVAPVSWLNFYIDGTWVASSPPYTYAWNSTGVANGQHAIAVNGYNSSNALVATTAMNVKVQNGSSPTPTPAPTGSATPKPSASPSSTATPGYYSLLPSGSALPSDSQCAAGVAGDTFEPVPGNAVPNNTMMTASDLSTYSSEASGGEGGSPGSYLTRADGQFTGTTDAILKWASCKWGFDENVTRATAVNETHWIQPHIGDIGNGTSLGILQIKSSDYPSTCESVASSQNTNDVTNSNCYSYLSTAFAADYKLAQQRACFEGQVSYLTSDTPSSGYPTYPNGTPDQMMWGCVGWWYSGHWYDSGALNYISQVQGYLSAETWLQPGGVGN